MALFLLHILSLLVIHTPPLGTSFIEVASILLIHVPVCASTKSMLLIHHTRNVAVFI